MALDTVSLALLTGRGRGFGLMGFPTLVDSSPCRAAIPLLHCINALVGFLHPWHTDGLSSTFFC